SKQKKRQENYMRYSIIAAFMFLIIICLIGCFIAINSRINELEYEIAQKEIIQNEEIEQVKKNQRITAQDVDFLEKLVVEGGK
ncbi:MAG: hypothetical protein J6S67_07345, partial [Methanobrevibacter sp.]|nr:hypothetical protein [Methanobrevibacter sp.]